MRGSGDPAEVDTDSVFSPLRQGSFRTNGGKHWLSRRFAGVPAFRRQSRHRNALRSLLKSPLASAVTSRFARTAVYWCSRTRFR
jgi:hypothetical protein